MFHDIPQRIVERMRVLEALDARDRTDGTPHRSRLRQVPPETGRLLAILAASAPAGRVVEVGTSAGYSTLWLALAARAAGRRITTIELLEDKARLARETFALTGVGDVVEAVTGDALSVLPTLVDVGFLFLDADKEIYGGCYEAAVPRLVAGGLLVADNATSHAEELRPMLERALSDERVDALVVPIGKGVLVARKR